MVNVACKVAHLNGLYGGPGSGAACVPGNDTLGTSMAVNYPPSAAAGTFAGRPGFVEVAFGRNYQTLFGRVIGITNIPVSSSAVAAFSSGDSNTNALMALDPTSCSSLKTHGTGAITIHSTAPGATGGYVQVNSSCSNGPSNGSCDNGGGGAALDTTGGSAFTAPAFFVNGTCKANSPVFGTLTEGAVKVGDPLSELAPPDPADYLAGQCGPGGIVLTPTGPNSHGCTFNSAGTTHINPGVYYGGWDVSKKDAVLELGPGVYIIAGGGIKLSNSRRSRPSRALPALRRR